MRYKIRHGKTSDVMWQETGDLLAFIHACWRSPLEFRVFHLSYDPLTVYLFCLKRQNIYFSRLLVFTLPVLIVCSCDITKLRLNCFLDSDFWLKFLMDCLCNILLVRSSPYSTESYTILHKTLMWSCHSVSFITLLNDEYVWQSVNDPSIIWVGISA